MMTFFLRHNRPYFSSSPTPLFLSLFASLRPWSLAIFGYAPYLLLSLLFLACSGTHTAYTGEYRGQRVEVLSTERKGFSTNSITYELHYGSLPPLVFEAGTTDLYDRPYSPELFREVPHVFFDTLHTAYLNEIDFERQVTPTMLYLSPKKFTREDFDAYADFFRHQWPACRQAINHEWTYLTERYVGIAYGERSDFTRYFFGQEEGKPYFFDVSPDGVISYHAGRPGHEMSTQGSGLSVKVQMPGQVILLNDSSFFTRARLQNYRDLHNKSLSDYFNIRSPQPQANHNP